jgi:3-deoxy-D-manno-octulosonic-acid transferase
LKLPQLRHSIWIHAVSVGEMKAVERLVEKIRIQFPGRPIVVSTVTPTGQQLARERSDIIDHAFYFPLDLPGAVRRALDRVAPDLVIVAETEIWPNFLRLCGERRVPVMMINGRISDTSLPRYLRLQRWLRPVLDNYAVFGMQSETDRQRIEKMGAASQRVRVFGNLKYDMTATTRRVDPALAELLRAWHELWIAASTMQGEDEFVLDAFAALRRSHDKLKLMIAPRHPQRAAAVVELARSRGLVCMRRSQLQPDVDVIVLDTIGELAGLFQFASVVFMGGSLVERGGHNVLEPAQQSKPVIFGPHMENFREIARSFLQADAAIQISKPSELAPSVSRVLENADLAQSLGNRAKQIVIENTGATDRVVEFIRTNVLTSAGG